MRSLSTIILGGGLAGLAAGYALTKSGVGTKIFECNSAVGGLSRTIRRNGFSFDLGGHRFFTNKPEIDALIRDLMGDELVSVPRHSKIYLRNNFFDYPLRPLNAVFGMGIPTTVKIVEDYVAEKLRSLRRSPKQLSLEDWVVANFGRTMFNIYFREYSEKVWGKDCKLISADWVAQRISGLSLGKAISNAFFKFNGRNIPSLVDSFSYPQLGIGRIAERLREEIEKCNDVYTGFPIVKVKHSRSVIDSIETRGCPGAHYGSGNAFISSIPVTMLVRLLDPPPPAPVLTAAADLIFRDLVVVAVMIDGKQATNQTWIYFPEKKIPFGRIHEPTNWSGKMAPEGKTIVVAEHFCFEGDRIWNASDDQLADITSRGLEQIGFIRRGDVLGSAVVRVKNAYPLFEIGYAEQCEIIYSYLGSFRNLYLAGRSGMFRYYNMDYAIESGLHAADAVIQEAMNKRQCAIGMVA